MKAEFLTDAPNWIELLLQAALLFVMSQAVSPGRTNRVDVLKEGYARDTPEGVCEANGSSTLVRCRYEGRADVNVVVDTGSPWDREALLKGLEQHSLTADDIHYVVCSHGHVDHVGNLNLFTGATHIVSHDIVQIGDRYVDNHLSEGQPYKLAEDVTVIPTPGHTHRCVSVVVGRTGQGTVVVSGDLFECAADLEDESIWRSKSEFPELHKESRARVLSIADWIVPGHGAVFAVPAKYHSQSPSSPSPSATPAQSLPQQ